MTQYSGVYSLQTQGQALTSGQWCTDPYYKNTTLLLHADGVAGGAQNNTFLDSSTNAFAITRNGNTTQGSFTPYGPTWSNYFGGSSDYLSVATVGTNLSQSNFTIEAWVYITSLSANRNICGATSSDYGSGFEFSVETNANVVFKGKASGSTVLSMTTGNNAVSLNTWTHVAIVKNSSAFTIYVNGVSASTATYASTWSDITTISIGELLGSPVLFPFAGYISNFRIVKGTAVYTSAFAPSTKPLTAITNTALLTCQSNRFVDNSANVYPITVGSSPSVQRFSPFAPQYQYTPAVIGGSGYFDGSGDYLDAPSTTSSAFAFGTGDFSIELWTYLPSVSSYGRIFTSSANTSNMDFSGGGAAVYYDGSSYTVGTFVPNEWQHIVVTRNSGTLRTFLNGVMKYNGANSTNVSANAQYAIAAASGGTNATQQYMSNVRIIKGGIPSAYVTSSTTNGTSIFTPPTAPFTGSESLTAGSVSLLLNMTNAGIYDNAMMNNLETVGNAQVSTSVVKYGSGSLAFDGSGDYLQAPHTTVAEFGSGNFTVEFWAYINAQSGAYTGVVGQWVAGASNAANSWNVSTNLYNTTNKLGFSYSDGSATTDVAFGSALTTGTWSHYAICRSGNLLYAFKDGVLLNTGGTSITATINNGTSVLRVGSVGTTGGGSDFNGYLDDLRITKGVARYTANFQPPKVAFANQ